MLRLVALICLLLPSFVHAQDSNFRTWVLVTSPEAVSVSDDQLGDIEVLQDGHPAKEGRPIIQRDVRFHIGLVFYESGSGGHLLDHDASLQHVLDWAANTVQGKKGDAFLVGFNDSIVISTEITTDTPQLQRALSQLHPVGGSALRDAIIHSAHKFDSVPQGAQPMAPLLVIVTDGHDNASRANEREVIESVQSSGGRAYVICLPGGGTFDKSFLKHVSSNTGGRAFFPTTKNDLDRALGEIENALANSFLIGFVPESHDGKAHELTVRFPKTKSNFGYMPVFYSPAVR